jgi:hypothetical protein
MTEVTEKLMGTAQSFDMANNAEIRLFDVSWWIPSSGEIYVREILFSLFRRQCSQFFGRIIHSKSFCIAQQCTCIPFKLQFEYTQPRPIAHFRVRSGSGQPDGICMGSRAA